MQQVRGNNHFIPHVSEHKISGHQPVIYFGYSGFPCNKIKI